MSSDALLRLAVGSAVAGPSPPYRTFYGSAPSDMLPEPDPYVVYSVDTYGSGDLLPEMVDVNVDVYGFLGSTTSGPDTVDTIVGGIHAAMQGVVLANAGGTLTAFYRTRRQPMPTDDARVTRVRLTYQANWSSQQEADALAEGEPS